ncbi:hypothetical protein [Winogradskya consettensis]|uniref:hypothetical protein n=1 Tax=Winogradskya consettensis TaxID=113560 RepID=UPI001FD30496|nr:hypothetical protein [Actinoplanes consettensis]
MVPTANGPDSAGNPGTGNARPATGSQHHQHLPPHPEPGQPNPGRHHHPHRTDRNQPGTASGSHRPTTSTTDPTTTTSSRTISITDR